MTPRAALFAAFFLIAACETSPFPGGPSGRVNYATGSALGTGLSSRDIDALYPAFLAAVERGAKGAEALWSSGSASGAVTPGEYLVGNLKPDPRTLMPVDGGLDLGHSFETELGLHALSRNANLRAGPADDARVLSVLDAGTAIDVVGKTVGAPWYLIAVGGRVKGYIHQSLAVKAPGTELELAGGPVRRAALCRQFSQRLTVLGRTDRWTGVACDRGEGWRLEDAPAVS